MTPADRDAFRFATILIRRKEPFARRSLEGRSPDEGRSFCEGSSAEATDPVDAAVGRLPIDMSNGACVLGAKELTALVPELALVPEPQRSKISHQSQRDTT